MEEGEGDQSTDQMYVLQSLKYVLHLVLNTVSSLTPLA